MKNQGGGRREQAVSTGRAEHSAAPRGWWQILKRDANWWMVILTAAWLLVTYWQYDLARDSLEIANRAYVTVSNGKVFQLVPDKHGAWLRRTKSHSPDDLGGLPAGLKLEHNQYTGWEVQPTASRAVGRFHRSSGWGPVTRS